MSRGARREEIVVVGGGPAGASAACLLAGAGRSPLLLERDAGPRHKICGEFLSVEARTCLADLGIDPRALGGSSIASVRLVHYGQVAEANLPFQAVGLSRRKLDEAVLSEAEARGATVLRGAAVRALRSDGPDLLVETSGHGDIRAGAVFLACGKHDVRGARRPAKSAAHDLIGFKTHFSFAPSQRAAIEGVIEVILFDGGYAGLQMVEDGMANLCLLVRRRAYEHVGKTWEALLGHLRATCPHLGERLEGATAVLDRPLSIFAVPYGFLHTPRVGEPQGLFRLGDQVGVTPSFSGDGMSIALHSARLAAETCLARGNAAAEFHARIRRDIGGQIRVASLLDRASRSRLGRQALVTACRASPKAMRLAAAWTRVPEAALARSGG